jgi:hypothetical protein
VLSLIVNEEVFAAMFELAHNSRGDITGHEDGNFG